MKDKIKQSKKRKIVKAGVLGDENLDDGMYIPAGIRKGKGKKPREIHDFKTSGGESFSVQIEHRKKNTGETIQKAHRRYKLKKALRLKDPGGKKK